MITFCVLLLAALPLARAQCTWVFLGASISGQKCGRTCSGGGANLPTPAPTPGPTPQPTPAPTPQPTPAPTPQPTPAPTPLPTPAPTPQPGAPCTNYLSCNQCSNMATTAPRSCKWCVSGGASACFDSCPTTGGYTNPASCPTPAPTPAPSPQPTPAPTPAPTPKPSPAPTPLPPGQTGAPSPAPTPAPPTMAPSPQPTPMPASCVGVAQCSGGGTCVATNTCQCFADFNVDPVAGCKRKAGAPICAHVSNCNGGGACVGQPDQTGRCQCNAGFDDDNVLGCRAKPTTLPNDGSSGSSSSSSSSTMQNTSASGGATDSEIVIPRKELLIDKDLKVEASTPLVILPSQSLSITGRFEQPVETTLKASVASKSDAGKPLIVASAASTVGGRLELSLDFRPVDQQCVALLKAPTIDGKYDSLSVQLTRPLDSCVTVTPKDPELQDGVLVICLKVENGDCMVNLMASMSPMMNAGMEWWVYAAIGGGGFCVIVTILVVVCITRRKSSKKDERNDVPLSPISQNRAFYGSVPKTGDNGYGDLQVTPLDSDRPSVYVPIGANTQALNGNPYVPVPGGSGGGGGGVQPGSPYAPLVGVVGAPYAPSGGSGGGTYQSFSNQSTMDSSARYQPLQTASSEGSQFGRGAPPPVALPPPPAGVGGGGGGGLYRAVTPNGAGAYMPQQPGFPM